MIPADRVPPYAGGSCGITHIDLGMLRMFCGAGCRSLLDVGCGPGGQVQAAKTLGMRAIGVEVDPSFYRAPGVALINLCDQPVTLPEQADLVWSIEVAEHVPLECAPNYLATLRNNARVAICMTANQEPMQLHVNCRPTSWWIEQVEATGEFRHDPNTPTLVAENSTMQREFLRETGMIFWRVGGQGQC
jgi:hypothetical protein